MNKTLMIFIAISAVIVLGAFVYIGMVKSGKIKAVGSSDCCLWDGNNTCIAKIGDPKCEPGDFIA